MEIFNSRIPPEDNPRCGTDTLRPPNPGGDGGGGPCRPDCSVLCLTLCQTKDW